MEASSIDETKHTGSSYLHQWDAVYHAPSGREAQLRQTTDRYKPVRRRCYHLRALAAKKVGTAESYGPKFCENIVQAISRDISYAMQTLRTSRIVAHVHDELIIECPPEVSLQAVSEQMGRTPPWAPGLVLRADGDEMAYYQKA